MVDSKTGTLSPEPAAETAETKTADPVPAAPGAASVDPGPIDRKSGQATWTPPAVETVDLEPVKRALMELNAPAVSGAKEHMEKASGEPVPGAAAGRIGVLLINLGTPDAADAKSVRRYLRQFLSDPRVIENDSFLWRMVLNGFILPLRPRVKARAYQKIWNNELNESPLKSITRAQAERLGATLAREGIVVDWAMRYGNPPIPERLEAMVADGCERILLMPLYPQYSATTTATACDVAFRTLTRMRRQPAVRVVPPYYGDQFYIEALASSVNAQLRALRETPDVILASYHGMPKAYVDRGDPYEDQCVETTRLLRERLGLDESKLMMSYQSRFGRAKWLTPATDKTVRRLAKSGVKNLAVIMPGFAADCIETLEEIAIENAQIFKRAGGENFVAIPCLNDSDAGMTMLWRIVLRELRGWI